VRRAGDRSGVTGRTAVLSDRITVRIVAGYGESLLDRMIALVEGAVRQRTPNEIALSLVLTAFTLIFLIVVVPLWPMALNAEVYMTSYLGLATPLQSLGTDVPTLVALVVCLIPTTSGAFGCDQHCRNGPGVARQYHRQKRARGRDRGGSVLGGRNAASGSIICGWQSGICGAGSNPIPRGRAIS
jgi:hypothetical protein